MEKTHKIGGYELAVDRQMVAGEEVYYLEVRSRSSLDYLSVILNLRPSEFKDIVNFLEEFK